MNKFTTLVFCLLLSFGASFAQRIDYDNSSKWFLGFNLGGTWQTTDVQNKTNIGYGLTLGKSFNYNYGRKLTFDLRARYLRGFWYGQDYDTTSLTSYGGGALNNYKDSLGFSVNNFQADVYRLGFELVIHANGIRERTGWDPYIFGGVGFTWHQTNGNLYNNDSLGTLYNYDPSILNNSYINSTLDAIYDSPLDGSKKDVFRVGFMPSLGFGLGYQVGKRVSIGLEHKSTFTLIDDFDGFVAPSKYRDIYHYTSAYIQFRFRTGDAERTGGSNLNNVDNYNQNNAGGCVTPKIKFITPENNQLSALQMQYVVVAEIKDVLGRDNISFSHNGVNTANFTYNPTTDRLECSLVLTPGINTFEIRATNTCGVDIQTTNLNYTCIPPAITFTNPSANGTTVRSANFTLSALIQNAVSTQNITVSQNNLVLSSGNLNAATNQYENNVTLANGTNIFVLTATNACGTDAKTITIIYDNCLLPNINVITPAANGTTVANANYALTATLQNIANKQGISITQNGRALTNFTFNTPTGAFQNSVTLIPGANTFLLSTTNSCGTDTETITLNFQNCIPPNLIILSPAANGTTVTNANYTLTATIQNIANSQGISITQNGRALTNFTFNTATGAFQNSVTLTPGANTFLLSTTNSCGTDTETFTIVYSNCIPPSISIVSPATNGSTVTNASFPFSAFIQNSNNGQGINFTQNGAPVSNAAFNVPTGSLQKTVTLVPGLNTFVLTATNSCGTDTETISVTYQPCVAPVISILAPVSNGTTVTTAAFTFTATILNSNNGQGIGFTQNGKAINGVNFNTFNNTLSTAVTLVPGVNTFVVVATNSCGTDTETITIVYDNCIPPSISIVSPATNESTVTNASFPFSAFIQNSNNGQGINFTQNGAPVSNTAFNIPTGSLQKTVTLLPGINTFVLTATNSCGTDTEIITINFQNCLPPAITLASPLASGITVNSASFAFAAFIQNSNNGQGVTLSQNGRPITNYSFNNATGSIQSALTLSAGVNTLVLSSTNSCGTDSETITITFDNCIAPTISLIDPPANGATVTNANFSISALILNSNNGQGITLTHNGRTINNFSFNNGTNTLQSNLTLVPGVNTFIVTATNPCGIDTETITITYQPCVAPVISVLAPASNGTTVTTAAFTFTATILNSNNGQEIGFTQNGRAINSVNFNTANNTLSTAVTLVPGVNTFIVTATNSCGTDTETITITYQPCVAPVISVLAPASNGTTVTNAALTFTATILNSNNGQGIGFTQNGRAINGVNFNTANNTLSTSVTLVPGVNTFVVTATNSCGTDTETITILYSNCIPPSISIVSPATNGSTVTTAAFTFTATILNSNNGQGIGFTQNGRAINGVNFNTANNTLSTTVTLAPGVNTFIVTATNSCGTDTETITITYQPCVAPVISILAPATNGTTVATAGFTFTATILNSNNGQGIGFTQNGRAINGVNFNTANNTLSTGVTLAPGVNTFVVSATNSCGTDTETITITYQPCIAPVISILAPASNGTTVTTAALTFTATILNSNNGQGIGFTQNGRAINSVNFNTANNTLSTSLTLVPGVNTFVVTATNSCGTDTETITITYQPCVAPVISILAPASNGTTVATAAFTFTATILNSNNGQGIGFTQNGRAINGVNFNTANNTLSTSVTLVPGVNTFVVTATNSCGTDTETITITYQPCVAPVISILAPASNGTTVTTAALTFTATILNSNNGQGIGFTQNGRAINGVNFNTANNTLSTGVTLAPGVNTFVVSATNSCGTDTETITITYQPCVAPVISILAPASNGTTVTTAAFTFTATILNSNNGQGIGFTQNGRAINGVNFNTANNTLSTGVTLVPGVNTFVVSATNSCGTDTETITINYVPQAEDKKPSPGKQAPTAPGTGRGGK